MPAPRSLSLVLACACLIPGGLLASGCDREETPDAKQYQADAPKAGADAPPPGPPAAILGISTTGWQGIEARLSRCDRVANMLSVEVQLVNVGGSNVALEHYSAADAQITDEATKNTFGIFEQHGTPAASTDVTDDLGPGESATINAVFPVPGETSRVTISFPNVGPFAGIQVPGRAGQEQKATPRLLRNAESPTKSGTDKPASNR